jgi:hypothetical protein
LPTIEVSSTPLTPSARLRAAVRLTRWLAAHGSRAAHVVVTFRTVEPMAYFCGGVPLTTYADGATADGTGESATVRWASVVCRVHPDRDHAYRAELAEEIREALGLDGDGAHLTVRFEPTQPERVFYLDSGSMTSGGPAAPAGRAQQKGTDHAHH